MKRILLFVTCFAFLSSPLFAEDWVSLLRGMAAGAPSNDVTLQKYTAAIQRLATEDAQSARMEISQLADIYDQHPETRFAIGSFLYIVAYGRLSAFGGTTDAFIAPLQPIVPTLVHHLFDGDPKATEAAMGVFTFVALQQNPSVDIVEPLIDLSRTETKPSGALRVIAIFCAKSKQAVLALSDAMAADQPFEKRLAAIEAVGLSSGPTCTDPEWVNGLSEAMKSDWHLGAGRNAHPSLAYEGEYPSLVEAAVRAASRLGPRLSRDAAALLKVELERIAQDKAHPVTAQAASEALGQLQR